MCVTLTIFCFLKAERAGMRQRITGLEEDMSREKEDSIPWKNILRHLESLLSELERGEVGRQSPSMGPSMKDKKLQRLFEDLRDKMNENLQKNEDEKEAVQKELQKVSILFFFQW